MSLLGFHSYAGRILSHHLIFYLIFILFPFGSALSVETKWTQGTRYQSLELQFVSSSNPGFTLTTPSQTGVLFENNVPEYRHLTNQIILNGAGVAAADFDSDGFCDLYFCSTDGDNALYHNLGDWRFENIAEEKGVACRGFTSTGAVFADLDNDGRLDW